MKIKYYLNLAVLLAFGLTGSEICNAQSLAIGHITAEVIEWASISSQAATNVSLGTSSSGNTSINTQLAVMMGLIWEQWQSVQEIAPLLRWFLNLQNSPIYWGMLSRWIHTSAVNPEHQSINQEVPRTSSLTAQQI